MGFLYKFLDKEDKILYIGKTEKDNILDRMKNHEHLPQPCYENLNKILYTEISNLTDLAIYEIFLIDKYKPEYNKEFNYASTSNLKISMNCKWKELDYKNFGLSFQHRDRVCSKNLLSKEEIRERQKIGIEKAKQLGKYKGRKKIELPESFYDDVKRWYNKECTAVSVYKKYNISSQTFYRRVKELEKNEE